MQSQIKRTVKRNAMPIARAIAKMLPSGDIGFGCLRSVSKLFLDPEILPNSTQASAIARSNFEYLCNPYLFTHIRPFWTGRLHEVGIECFLRKYLKAGDRFIDVGANYGHVSMLAAAILGAKANLLAYEPNPVLASLLESHFREQRLENAILKNCALGNIESVCELTIPERHPGLGNLFGRRGTDSSDNVKICKVDVNRADGFVSNWLRVKASENYRVVIKVDVEGYEIPVIEGFGDVLKDISACIIEISPDWIGGETGVNRLWSLLCSHGREGYLLSDRGSITKVSPCELNQQANVVFALKSFFK